MCRIFLATFLTALTLRAADFSRDIAPILVSECLTCHSAEKAKGGYRLHNYAAVLQPGKSRQPTVVPGKPDDSELFKRLVTHDEDDRMPQDDEPLTTNQIALFREWIAAGATLDRGETNAPLALLIPRENPAPPESYPRPVPILALAFTPDSRLAVSGYHEITVWNFDGTLHARITNAPARIHAIAFHPTATNIFAIAGGKPGRNGEVSIFQNNQFLTNIAQHSDEFLCVAFSPNGELLAAGGSDNSIRIFKTGTWEKSLTIQQHADWVTSVEFNPAGDIIVSASRDRTARVYDAASGELETTYTSHSAAVVTALFISPDQLASAGRDKTIHLWDLKEGKKRHEISGAESDITALLATDKFLFAASADKNIRQYQLSDRKLIRTYTGHNTAVFSIAYNPTSAQLASGSLDGTVKLWNTETATAITTFTASPVAKK
jgi:WD40 repeat protein